MLTYSDVTSDEVHTEVTTDDAVVWKVKDDVQHTVGCIEKPTPNVCII